MAAPVGTPTTGGRTSSGAFTVALPASATGFIAAVERKAGSVTPPSGWTLLASVVRDSTWSINEIYTAGASPGTSWNFTGTGTPAAIAVVILGLDGAPTVEQNANAASLTAPTTASTAGAALIVRAAFNQPAVGTEPTWTYPAGAALARTSSFQTASGEGWNVAIAASQQASAGAPGTAAFSASPTFGVGSWTLAITTPAGGGPTAHPVSGTASFVSGASGTATRPARAKATTGTAAFTSSASGSATRPAAAKPVSGTSAFVSSAAGAATRPSVARAVSGTAAFASGASGSATVTGAAPKSYPVSGTASFVSGASGAATAQPAVVVPEGPRMFHFTPPVTYQRVYPEQSALWRRARAAVPVTVVKTRSGAYIQELEHDPDRPDIDTVYAGGHVYLIPEPEADRLMAAGYTATEVA